MDQPEESLRGSEQRDLPSRVASDVDVPVVVAVDAGIAPRHRHLDADDFVTAAFESYRGEIFTFLARTTRDDAAAEDLLQETFLRLSREARAGRAPDELRAWLYRVAGNLATSRFRRSGVARRWLERFTATAREEPPEPSPEAGVLDRERYRTLNRALATVSPEARSALLMASQGFSGREIAQALGRSEVATRALMCRARVRLRTELEEGAP